MLRRGLPYADAIAYVGVKRRTFDEKWRPRLVAIPQGNVLVFDRTDLDRLFDQFKQEAAGQPQAANDSAVPVTQNAHRNGRPANRTGAFEWANDRGVSTPHKTGPGKSIGGSTAPDFASVASGLTRKRKAG